MIKRRNSGALAKMDVPFSNMKIAAVFFAIFMFLLPFCVKAEADDPVYTDRCPLPLINERPKNIEDLKNMVVRETTSEKNTPKSSAKKKKRSKK